jgi:DMSO/TMAO reductase YedYZ molybdopterin-dependent catalytic subunit
VTKWSKFDTHWEGVSLDTLLAQVKTAVSYVVAFFSSYAVYTSTTGVMTT